MTSNFLRSQKVAVVGKMAQEDFTLTRQAAYLVAIGPSGSWDARCSSASPVNGDPNHLSGTSKALAQW